MYLGYDKSGVEPIKIYDKYGNEIKDEITSIKINYEVGEPLTVTVEFVLHGFKDE